MKPKDTAKSTPKGVDMKSKIPCKPSAAESSELACGNSRDVESPEAGSDKTIQSNS